MSSIASGLGRPPNPAGSFSSAARLGRRDSRPATNSSRLSRPFLSPSACLSKRSNRARLSSGISSRDNWPSWLVSSCSNRAVLDDAPSASLSVAFGGSAPQATATPNQAITTPRPVRYIVNPFPAFRYAESYPGADRPASRARMHRQHGLRQQSRRGSPSYQPTPAAERSSADSTAPSGRPGLRFALPARTLSPYLAANQPLRRRCSPSA